MSELSEKLWCVVPAAGTGSRFGADKPKQYCELVDKPLLQVTLEVLLKINFEAILVAVHRDDDYWRDIKTFELPGVETVTGGLERADSVLAGLKQLKGRAKDNDWVLVHDVARPCVLATDIQHLITQVTSQSDVSGGLLAAPVSDTIKQVEHTFVSKTLDRNKLWAALTPQMFRYGELKRALNLMIEQGQLPTDEASAMENSGAKVMLVHGRRDNIKITEPEDLSLAEAIINYQQRAGER